MKRTHLSCTWALIGAAAGLGGACASSSSAEDFTGSKTAQVDEVEPADEIDVVRVLAPQAPPVEVEITELALTPVNYMGTTISGRARVDEVISDRGFYLGAKPNRVFAVVREDAPKHEMIDIDAGEIIDFSGLLLTPGAQDDLTGTLEQDTRAAIDGASAFIAMHHADVKIVPPEPSKQ